MATGITAQLSPLVPHRVSTPELSAPKDHLPESSLQQMNPLRPVEITGRDVGAAVGRNPVEAKGNQPMDEEALSEVVRNLNNLTQMVRRELQFSLDDDGNRMIVKVIDSETDEVIRQIPPEEVLVIARHLKESLEGGLFKERA